MLGKSTHLQVIPQQSTQTQQTFGYRHTTKTSGLFCATWVGDFSSRNKFANLKVFFAKVSVPVQSIIPCWTHLLNCGYGMKHSYRYLLGQVPAFVFCYSFDFFCLLKTRLKYARQVGFLVFVSFVLVL